MPLDGRGPLSHASAGTRRNEPTLVDVHQVSSSQIVIITPHFALIYETVLAEEKSIDERVDHLSNAFAYDGIEDITIPLGTGAPELWGRKHRFIISRQGAQVQQNDTYRPT